MALEGEEFGANEAESFYADENPPGRRLGNRSLKR